MHRVFRSLSLPLVALFATLGTTSCGSGGDANALSGGSPLATAQRFASAIEAQEPSLLEATFTLKTNLKLR